MLRAGLTLFFVCPIGSADSYANTLGDPKTECKPIAEMNRGQSASKTLVHLNERKIWSPHGQSHLRLSHHTSICHGVTNIRPSQLV